MLAESHNNAAVVEMISPYHDGRTNLTIYDVAPRMSNV